MRTSGLIWLIGGMIYCVAEIAFFGNRLSWVIFNSAEMIVGAILLVGSKIK